MEPPRRQQLQNFLRAERGLWTVPDAGLALDPRGAAEFAFVSHAHADHVGRARRVLAQRDTARLIRERFGAAAAAAEWVELDYGQECRFAGHRAILLPAGHAPGSAMLWLEREAEGVSLLYTGDFKRGPNPVATACAPRRADLLLMETTFGLPQYRFPPVAQTLTTIRRWLTAVLADGGTPVLLAYSFGKAQELVAHFSREFPLRVHPAVAEMNRSCEGIGLALGPWKRLGADPEGRKGAVESGGFVVIAPPSAARSTAIRRLPGVQRAMCSGWALGPGATYRYQVEQAFPLSDHADFDELLATVAEVDPRLVLTAHGFAREFAAELRRRGRTAWALEGEEQLELAGGLERERLPGTGEQGGESSAGTRARKPQKARPDPTSEPEPRPDWRSLSRIARIVGAEPGKSAKVRLLAAWLGRLEAEDAARAAGWLGGEFINGAPGLGWAAVKRALGRLGVAPARLAQVGREQGDSARTTRLVLEEIGAAAATAAPGLAELDDWIGRLTGTRAPQRREAALAELLGRLGPDGAELLVGCLFGSLRRGLDRGLIEEAIGVAAGLEADELRRARLLAGGLRRLARAAFGGRSGELELEPGTPIAPMLAAVPVAARQIREQGRNAAETIWAELARAGRLWVEPKHDGIRAQLHVDADGRVSLFSRDLRSLAEFPELLTAAGGWPVVVLDGEIVAQGGFPALQRRLGRKGGPDQAELFAEHAPAAVRFLAFDCLHLDGRPLWRQALRRRREMLETLPWNERLALSPAWSVAGAPELEERFARLRREGGEGLIAKDPESPYDAGRRGRAWLKLKETTAVLTCVVIKAEQGHGKRSHLLSDTTFALRGTRPGEPEWAILGKAYSGLTETEIEELTEWFEVHTVSRRGRVRTVEPRVVLEIGFDSIQPSNRWNSGLSLRFPRIVRWRRDLVPADADDLERARRLAGLEADSPV